MKKGDTRKTIIAAVMSRTRPFTYPKLQAALSKIAPGTLSSTLHYMVQAGVLEKDQGRKPAHYTVLPSSKTTDEIMADMRGIHQHKTAKAARTVQPSDVHEDVNEVLALIQDGRRYRMLKPHLLDLFKRME